MHKYLNFLSKLLLTGASPLVVSLSTASGQTAGPTAYDGPVIAVTYLEFSKSSSDNGRKYLRQLEPATTATRGLEGRTALAEISMPGRYVVIDAWSAAQSQKDQAQSVTSLERMDWKMQGAIAPADIRLHKPYNVSASKQDDVGSIYIVTHVDVPPASLSALEVIFKPLIEQSRREPASQRFDVLQSTTRPNHFTMVESWSSETAAEAHAKAAHTIEFREKLNPLLGALYDQRMFVVAR